MRKLSVFNQVSLDGFIADQHGDMSWAHKQDPEWLAFMGANASGGGALLFGRVTYDLMEGYWPTPAAYAANPEVAGRMAAMPKIVFSRTLERPSWENTTVLSGDPAAEVRSLKEESGPDMVILGSGSIVARLTEARLIDAYQVVVNPVVLGGGVSMFQGVADRLSLELTGTRAFDNGNVVLWYERTAAA